MVPGAVSKANGYKPGYCPFTQSVWRGRADRAAQALSKLHTGKLHLMRSAPQSHWSLKRIIEISLK